MLYFALHSPSLKGTNTAYPMITHCFVFQFPFLLHCFFEFVTPTKCSVGPLRKTYKRHFSTRRLFPTSQREWATVWSGYLPPSPPPLGENPFRCAYASSPANYTPGLEELARVAHRRFPKGWANGVSSTPLLFSPFYPTQWGFNGICTGARMPPAVKGVHYYVSSLSFVFFFIVSLHVNHLCIRLSISHPLLRYWRLLTMQVIQWLHL